MKGFFIHFLIFPLKVHFLLKRVRFFGTACAEFLQTFAIAQNDPELSNFQHNNANIVVAKKLNL